MSSVADQPKDFSLRPLPVSPSQPAPNAAPGATVPSGTAVPIVPSPPDYARAMSANDMLVAGAILVVLACVFLFVRGGVRRHLISERASLSAAGNAGWAVFAFLLSVAATIVFGLFGNLWDRPAFTVPMGALVVVTLVLSILLYTSAARGRR